MADLTIVPIKSATPEPGSNLDYALKYAALGWHVFPVWGALNGRCRCGGLCKSPAKHPISLLVPRGQDDATTDAGTIRRWWAQMPNAGVAVFLRPSGLVAIDIDPRNGGLFSMEQVEAAHGPLVSDVLAYTQGGGEHRVFKLAADAAISLPGKLGPGVDVKWNGYIVLAPTRGVDGQYEWEASSDPLEGAIPSPLPDWLRNLSSNLAPVQSDATPAQRFVTPEQVAELRDALTRLPSDDRDTWVRHGMALRAIGQDGFDLWDEWSRKSDKYDPVDLMRVWRSFKPGAVNFESIFYAAQQAGWVNPLATGGEVFRPVAELTVPELSDHAPVRLEPVTPEMLKTIPVDSLQQAVEWMEGFSEEPNRQISVHGALALGSVLAGRVFESDNGNVSSMYLLTLAGTGVGKGYPKHAIRKLLNDAGLARLLSGSGNTSAGSVFSALFKSPTHIQISDEFGKHLQLARKQVNGAMADAFAVMTEAYSDATGMLVPRNYSHFHLTKKELTTLDSKIVNRPAVTLYAFATPEQVFSNLSSSEIDDGFLNRFVVCNVTDPCLQEQRIRALPVPDNLIEWARSMRGHANQSGSDLTGMDTDYDMAPATVQVRFSRPAWDQFDAFKREIKSGEYPEPKLTMRWRENAMRMATMLAAAENPSSPLVSAQLAAWAISYVRHYGTEFMLQAVTHVADNEFHRLYKLVSDTVAKSGPRGVTERDLSDKHTAFERANSMMRRQVFEVITREGLAQLVKIGTIGGRGRKREAWVSCSLLDSEDGANG